MTPPGVPSALKMAADLTVNRPRTVWHPEGCLTFEESLTYRGAGLAAHWPCRAPLRQRRMTPQASRSPAFPVAAVNATASGEFGVYWFAAVPVGTLA